MIPLELRLAHQETKPSRVVGQRLAYVGGLACDGTTTETLVCHMSQSRAGGVTEACASTVASLEHD